METKICPKCKEIKSVSEFQKNAASKDGLQYHCKPCRKEIDSRPEHRAQHRKRYHENKNRYTDSVYKRKYGIDLETYNKMLVEQNNTCAICQQECKSGRRLAVDHEHTTGKVRGLLCSACNQGVGMFKDNTVLLERAINYLIKYYD